MKLKHFYLASALALLAAGCSSDDPKMNAGQEPGTDMTSTGYLSVNINLPQTRSTRADETWQNDKFDDGVDYEYNVKDGMIILFTGNSEADAKFLSAHPISINHNNQNIDGQVGDHDNDNLTDSYQKVVQVTDLAFANKLFGLVILNYNDNGITLNGSQLTFGNDEITSGTTTFQNMLALTSEQLYKQTNDPDNPGTILMTNAPLCDQPGENDNPSSGNVLTLVNLTDKVYSTEAEAKTSPAAEIFVERAVAKITLSEFEHEVKGSLAANSDYSITVKNVEWCVDNTEPTSYFIRNMETSTNLTTWLGLNYGEGTYNKYRMVGWDKAGETSIQPYRNLHRTYWCLDPTYKETGSKARAVHPIAYEEVKDDDGNVIEIKEKSGAFKTVPSSITENNLPTWYGNENTFTVANMDYKNTTRVVFKVTFEVKKDGVIVGGNDGFLVKSDDENTFYDKTAVEKELHGQVSAYLLKYFKQNVTAIPGTYNVDDYVEVSYCENKVTGAYQVEYVKINLTPDGKDPLALKPAETPATAPKKTRADEGDDTSDSGDDDTTGGDDSTGTTLTANYGAGVATDNDIEAAIEDINKNFVYYMYKGGVAYYTALIKHFGETYCPDPFTTNTQLTGNTTTAVYGSDLDATNKYLGRFGLVRNNWYDLAVTAINHLGDPKIPSADFTTSDDNKDKKEYIALRINVHAWAKRTQNIEF